MGRGSDRGGGAYASELEFDETSAGWVPGTHLSAREKDLMLHQFANMQALFQNWKKNEEWPENAMEMFKSVTGMSFAERVESLIVQKGDSAPSAADIPGLSAEVRETRSRKRQRIL